MCTLVYLTPLYLLTLLLQHSCGAHTDIIQELLGFLRGNLSPILRGGPHFLQGVLALPQGGIWHPSRGTALHPGNVWHPSGGTALPPGGGVSNPSRGTALRSKGGLASFKGNHTSGKGDLTSSWFDFICLRVLHLLLWLGLCWSRSRYSREGEKLFAISSPQVQLDIQARIYSITV